MGQAFWLMRVVPQSLVIAEGHVAAATRYLESAGALLSLRRLAACDPLPTPWLSAAFSDSREFFWVWFLSLGMMGLRFTCCCVYSGVLLCGIWCRACACVCVRQVMDACVVGAFDSLG